jgi:hypothetical protein
MIADVLQRDPGLRDANVIYVNYLNAMGRSREAEAALDKWERISPKQTSIKAMRIVLMTQRGDLAAAWRASEDLKRAGVNETGLDTGRGGIRYALGDADWILGTDLPGRQRAGAALLKGEKMRALELLATDPLGAVPQAALSSYIPIHYAAGDIKGAVSYYDDKFGSPEAAGAARKQCGCSMLPLVLALKDASHKDYKAVLSVWKASFAERQLEYKTAPGFQREMAEVAALEGDFATARANYTAVIDAGWRSPLFLGEIFQRLLPAAEGFDPLRARMKSLINKERTALALAPL